MTCNGGKRHETREPDAEVLTKWAFLPCITKLGKYIRISADDRCRLAIVGLLDDVRGLQFLSAVLRQYLAPPKMFHRFPCILGGSAFVPPDSIQRIAVFIVSVLPSFVYLLSSLTLQVFGSSHCRKAGGVSVLIQ